MNGIQVKYSELLSLAVTQLFYQNQVYAQSVNTPVLDIFFLPSAETKIVLNRLGLVLRNTDRNGGFTILAQTDGMTGPNERLRFRPGKADKLSFFMIVNNAAFSNFNEMPVSINSDNIFYFSNDVADAAAPRTSLHLSKLPGAVSSANDMIKKTGELYRYQHGSVVLNAKVKHLLTGNTLEPVSIVNEAGTANLIFDLSTLPSGKYELYVNNSITPDDSFYYSGLDSPRQFFGVVELNLFPMPAAGEYGITETDKSIKPVKPVFKLQFNNRPTTWRYTFELTPGSALYKALDSGTVSVNNLNIESNDNSIITFAPPVPTGTPITKLTFLSTAAVALREKYVTTASTALTLKLKAGVTDFKNDLPFPDTGKLDASAWPTVYSDVFITF